jgi:membrane-associated phospholipid phosphatase
VKWDPEWARFSTADWIITGTGAAITLASAIVPPLKKHSLGGGILFDDSARKTLRLPTSEGRYVARDASDVILSLEATWPFFVDALITTWWYHGSPDAAAQMALVDGEALAIVTAVQGATNTIVSRERPYGPSCGSPYLPNQTNDCEGNVHYRSFFSGHTAFTFMAASLLCVHHMKLDLPGGIGDELSCVTAYAGAAATGTLRVVGDMHYVSDVMVGGLADHPRRPGRAHRPQPSGRGSRLVRTHRGEPRPHRPHRWRLHRAGLPLSLGDGVKPL